MHGFLLYSGSLAGVDFLISNGLLLCLGFLAGAGSLNPNDFSYVKWLILDFRLFYYSSLYSLGFLVRHDFPLS